MFNLIFEVRLLPRSIRNPSEAILLCAIHQGERRSRNIHALGEDNYAEITYFITTTEYVQVECRKSSLERRIGGLQGCLFLVLMCALVVPGSTY